MLSLEGKANRLAGLVKSNLGAAMQGLVAVPLLAGFDLETGRGRIYNFDVAGGKYEEQRFASIGSGSVFARGSLKKLYRDGMSAEDVVLVLMQALYDAADDDSATGGPDMSRRIYPSIAIVTADGYDRLSDEQARRYAEAVVSERLQQPDGPGAPLRPAVSS
jgi:proteasome beta subunit